ncbi:MAG: FAD:protein FMN transferase [Hyphomicrobium sp.]
MQLFKFPFKAMGSPCEIQLYASNEERSRHIAELAVAEVARLEERYSRYRDTSFLSTINRAAVEGGQIEVDEETAHLLNYAAACHDQSGGLFDITAGLLRCAWRFEKGQLPDAGLIAVLLARIGWTNLHWEPPVLSFHMSGMELDFGGIVKEYAVDRAAEICRKHGAPNAMINLGGDISVAGPCADGSPWQVGIRHPRDKDAILQTIALHRGALASSGDYERCIEIDGKRYGHILNPKTGWPVSYLAAVSVIADFCVVAGSASTIAMLKEDAGAAWLQETGLAHVWVDVSGRIGGPLAPSSPHFARD